MDLLSRLNREFGDRYEIAGEIGRGGMAVVFRARDLRHERPVAIKVLRPELSASLGSDRFVREIQIAAGLQHPSIVPLYDSGERGGILYYVMPFVDGETLRARLRREKQLPLRDALHIVRQVADALSYAHSQGLVHRDIKPENILLTEGHALVADFGVARAITQAAGSELTESGIAIGTPAYMSPEQATGRGDLDHRSDIYALGCVLYEMLAGEPPFTGATTQSIIARHVSERPPRLRVVRPSVPEEVETAIALALAKVPADRFATAQEFVQALPDATAASQPVLAPLVRRRWRRTLTVAAGVMLGLAALVAVPRLAAPELDPTLYVIASFHRREGAAPTLLDGDQCQWRLSQAFRHWVGFKVVEQFQLADAHQRHGFEQPSSEGWLRLARGLGAGRLIRGEVAQFGDSVTVSASLFDVQRAGRMVQQASIMLLPTADDVLAKFDQLAAQLLQLELRGEARVYRSTRSIPAVNAFIEGQRAVEAGDLDSARARFTRALDLDPEFADAHLWFAQVAAWRGRPADEWRPSAARAAELRGRLSSPRDSLVANPLLSLARGAFAAACRGFRQALAADSGNVAAWLGLGECTSRDDVVRRDRASPSGWGFRSSYHAAATAYRRALELVPFLTAAVYPRLESVLPTQSQRFRHGDAASPDTGTFWARPVLQGDTLGFIPYPVALAQRATAGVRGAPWEDALARNRMVLRQIVERWAEAYPRSPEAHAALARTLESFGDLVSGRTGETSALSALQRARGLATSPEAALDGALSEVRLRVKTGDWRRARALAESLVAAAGERPGARRAEALAAVALLIGRPSAAGAMMARHSADVRESYRDPRMQGLPLPLFEAREHLVAYSLLGQPSDSVEMWSRRFAEILERSVELSRRDSVERLLLDAVITFAYPAVGRGRAEPPDSPNHLRRLQSLLEAGDRAAIREMFQRLDRLRADIPPGSVAIEAVQQEAWIRAALGDSAAAAAELERSLGALPTYATSFLSRVASAGGFIRAMVLRVRLAQAAGDTEAARRWAGRLSELLRNAEPEVQAAFHDVMAVTGRR